MKYYTLFLLFTLSTFLLATAQESCFECHGEQDFIMETKDGGERSLFVDAEKYSHSVHADFTCTDCHTDAFGDPHNENLNPVNCAMCHDDVEAHYLQGEHGKALAVGDSNAPTCASCHTTHSIQSETEETSSTYALNLPQTCGQCHFKAGNDSTVHPIMQYLKGAHGTALADGNDAAASCNDCHESHRTLSKGNPESKIFGFNISQTCAQCHEDIEMEYKDSIHGQALADGEFLAPTCYTCHGSHNIASASDKDSPTNRMNSAAQLCDPCHSVERLNERFGITSDVVSSYMDSYHGLASRGGSQVAANCNDCHGIHNIRSKNDSLATVHPYNVTETCSKCHDGASKNFSQSYSHTNISRSEDRVAATIRNIYIWVIVLVIGGMIVHNFIIWFYYVRLKSKEMKRTITLERFSRPAVFQHICLIVSFTILVITGFALKFPDAWWVNVLGSIGLDEIARGTIHRIAAVLLVLTSILHVLYVLLDKRFKKEPRLMAPRIQDAKDAIQNVAFYLGLSKTSPNFNKYSYIEKAEYWAMVWGTIVMILTGFVLWFPTVATEHMPHWIVKVSEVIHYYEAILATLSILIYHMFFAIFHPEDYPLNLTGFTGKITKEEAGHRFPQWDKDLQKEEQEKKKADSDSKDSE